MIIYMHIYLCRQNSSWELLPNKIFFYLNDVYILQTFSSLPFILQLFYQAMATARALNQSMPLIPQNRNLRNLSEHQNRNDTSRDKKQESKSKGPFQKLPTIRISKILKKIGAGDRSRLMYIPNQEDQASFRKSKWEELNREYSPRRYVAKPQFQGDLDEIVLDCWKFGENNGRKTVWRKYRQNCDDLTFDTLKVMKKK